MRRLLQTRILTLAFAALLAFACGQNPPPATSPTATLSPTGMAAYQATRVVKALDVFRDIAAEGERQTPKLISPANALRVIAYHRQVVQVIGAVPDGWQAVALAGLEQLGRDLLPAEWQRLLPFVNLLKVLFAETVGGRLDPVEVAETLDEDYRLELALRYGRVPLVGGHRW